jgi:hypothetical protein
MYNRATDSLMTTYKCPRLGLIALTGWLVLCARPHCAAQSSEAPRTLRFDHALICVSDLAPMQQGFADAGLQPDYGGHHGHASTQMAQLGFDDGTYIGIEAPATAAAETNTPQSALMKADAGPCGWSVTSTDLKSDLERIARLNVKVGVPEGRSRTRPDGTQAEWQSASVGGGAPGSNLPFLIQDKTSRSNRAPRASASLAASKISGVAIVVLGVPDLNESVALFRKVYDWPAPKVEAHPEFGARMAYFSGTPVVLAAPLSEDSWVAQRVSRLGAIPVAFLLRSTDFAGTVEHFSLPAGESWFGMRVSWFDARKLRGTHLGIVGN